MKDKTYMATDNFLFIPPDKVETMAFRFEVKPTSYNILNQIEDLEIYSRIHFDILFDHFLHFFTLNLF